MLSEIGAVVFLIASVIYLLDFFGIGFVNPIFSRASSDDELELEDDDIIIANDDSYNPEPFPTKVINCGWWPMTKSQISAIQYGG